MSARKRLTTLQMLTSLLLSTTQASTADWDIASVSDSHEPSQYSRRLTVRVETLGKAPDKLAVCHARSLLDIFARDVGQTIGNVVVYRALTVRVSHIVSQPKCSSARQRNPHKRVGSCETTPIRARQDSGEKSRMSGCGSMSPVGPSIRASDPPSPSKVMRPSFGS